MNYGVRKVGNVMNWQTTIPPKNRMIMRWHMVFKCAIPVFWVNEKVLQENGCNWIVGTMDNRWPEESFLPEWAECPEPPRRLKDLGNKTAWDEEIPGEYQECENRSFFGVGEHKIEKENLGEGIVRFTCRECQITWVEGV